jgi:hypothetical protein|tara:strand:- start:7612 stop:7908 length:297 start_codon:yes stop_codon:yes gene_type:complete
MDGILVALLMILTTLVFGFIYSTFDPEEFGFTESPMDPWYFSFTTMSTVGYGDFSPKTDRAKRMVMFHQALLIMEVGVFMAWIAKKMYKSRNMNFKVV